MNLLRLPFTGRPVGLALVVLLAGSCFQIHDCSFPADSCHTDDGCDRNFICEEGADLFGGKSCVPATECQQSFDCPSDSICEQRPAIPGTNPFAGDTVQKQV